MNSEDLSRERPSKNVGDRNRGHEPRNRFRAVLVNEPVRKINDYTGEKSGFGRAEQKARAVKLVWSVDKCSEGGERAPGDQRQREQPARAPTFDHKRAGNLQCEIADKKNSACRSEDRVTQAEIASHPERRVGDVGTIEIIRDVKKKKKRQNPPRNPTARAFCGVYLRRNHRTQHNSIAPAHNLM